jgi:plastocyanin
MIRAALATTIRAAAPISIAAILAACAAGASPTPAGPGSSPTGGAIEIVATEYAFDPSTLTVPAGPITFRIRNAGTLVHEFEVIRGETVVDEIEDLVPGLDRSITMTLEPGSYIYVCRLAGHEEAGMTGSLTVTAR